MQENRKILFYDGSCGFCNRVVQFILQHEKKQELYFCSLQSEFAFQFLAHFEIEINEISTVYFYDGRSIHHKSSAFFNIIPHTKWYLQFLRCFVLLPRKVTDQIYTWVAVRRNRWQFSNCQVINPKNKLRFIS